MKPLLKNWLFRNRNKHNNLLKTALPNFRKSCFSLYFLVIPFCAFSQNLVPNSSFELYDTCPNSVGQIGYATPWFGETVDYYNSCASTVCPYCSPPSVGGEFQYARTGNAFAGLYCRHGISDIREYLQVRLIDTLVNSRCYKISFFVNLHNGCIWGVNNIALHFSDTSFTNASFSVMNLSSDVFKLENPIITDTLGWTEISGIYFANGTEQFISIGNFKDDANTDTLAVNTYSTATAVGGYYYIDDVSVVPIDSIPGGMPAYAGNDATILSGDSIFIGQEITNLNCNWYVGSTLIADSISGLYVNPAVTTTYTVEQNLCGTITYDTVTVFVSGVGINENKLGEVINLFPNPNTGNFNLVYKSDIHIEIVDVTGSMIYSEILLFPSGASNLKLDIGNGVYFVRIADIKTHETIVKKLVIQK